MDNIVKEVRVILDENDIVIAEVAFPVNTAEDRWLQAMTAYEGAVKIVFDRFLKS